MSGMGYRFFKASDPLEIKEQQYAVGQEIRFSKFTSCMGIIGKQHSDVYGVHLVQQGVFSETDQGKKDAQLKVFGYIEALQIAGIFPSKLEFAIFIGNTGGFKFGACAKGYIKLIADFGEKTTLYRIYQDDGIFGARLAPAEQYGLKLYEMIGGNERPIEIATNV